MPIIKTLKNGVWTPVNSVTSLGTATPSTAGLMSASDKAKLDNVTEYSTDEVVVGTWVDGKPIYRKEIVLPSPVTLTGNTWTTIVNLSAYNPESLVDYKIYRGTGLTQLVTPFEAQIYNNNFSVWSPHNDGNVHTVILEYTKTTD